mgnify:CR=1 FL=1
MRSQTFVLALLLTILFVLVGDLFLPQPLAQVSTQTRTRINDFLVGLFPAIDVNSLYDQRFQDLNEG